MAPPDDVDPREPSVVFDDPLRDPDPSWSVATRAAPGTGGRLGWSAGAVVLVMAALFLVMHEVKGREEAALSRAVAARAAAPTAVDVVRVEDAPAVQTLSLPGEARAWYEGTIYARVDGYLATWLVDIGDRVRQGQVLARIDTPDLDQQLVAARAELAAAAADVKVKQADAAFAKSTYERWRDSPKGVVSEQEREAKKAAYASGAAGLNAAEAHVNLDQAKVDRLVALSQFKDVTAPFDGTITSRRVDIGDLVTAGSTSSTAPLYTVAQSDRIRVFVEVPQDAAVGLAPGTPAQVTAREYPGRSFDGTVARTADWIDPHARTLKVEVDLPNADLALVPGMYVAVRFALKSGAWRSVPASALLFRSGGPQVAVVGRDGVIHFRDVAIARDDGAVVEVASGVSRGERVALNPGSQIADGDKVAATDVASLSGAPVSAALSGPSTR